MTTSLGKAAGAAAARGAERYAGFSLSKSQRAVSAPFSSSAADGDGNGDGDNHFGVWQPNQTTVIFQQMEESCPDVMKAYARCVIDKQNSGALIQGGCDEQFQAVMKCFRSAR